MSGPPEPTVRLELLGPLQAWHGDFRLPLGPVQQRVVLAVLATHANRPVGRQQLIEAVWGTAAPAYAVNLVQKHVSNLRRLLEPVRSAGTPSRVLSWTDAGYQLSVPAGAVDAAVFDREVARARAARGAGDLPSAARLLHAALQLWRGPAFDGLVSPLLDAERDRLAERRLSAVEERIEVDLTLGEDRDLVAELRQLVADHPLRERLRALLMTALYRAGRQAEALAAFRDAHRYLLDELGVEPTAQLRELHQQILTNAPGLTPAVPIAAPVTGTRPPAGTAGTPDDPREPADRPPTPAQLPHGMPYFTGRAAELDRLTALVAGEQGGAAAADDPTGDTDPDGDNAAMVIAAIAGTAGVGKTSLAVHWAHQISHRFPDGQLYVNLRGFDPQAAALEPGEVIRGFLDALGVPAQRIPARLDGQAALYRSLLAGRRVLVLLDNARDTDQVRPLLPGSPGCLVVVTSRNRLSGLVAAGAFPLTVDLLSTAEARLLLSRRVGRHRVAAEPGAVDTIIDACARLPLALAVVAARAAVHPQFSLAALAAELRQARGGLDAFVGESAATDARAVLSWSYQMLSDDAARLFRLLGLHPGPDLGIPAAASLAGIPLPQARRLLAELSGAHLLQERTPGRFAFHDLLRAYAAEQTATVDAPAARHDAVRRLLDHYLHTAHLADGLLHPYRLSIPLDPADAAANVVEFADPAAALAWFVAEHAALMAAIDLASGTGFDSHTCQLAWSVTAFLNYQGHWHDWAVTQRAALAACQRLGDRVGQALAHRLLSLAHLQQGRLDDAQFQARQALALHGDLGDRSGRARVHLDLGRIAERQGDFQQALEQARQALELYRLAGDGGGEADALNWVGWYHSQLGYHEEALRYCRQSLDLQHLVGNGSGQADTWDSLGYAHHQLGHHDEARACFEQALRLWGNIGDRYEMATTMVRLGDTHRAAGDVTSAATVWQQAVALLDELDHPHAERVRAQLDRLDGIGLPDEP